MNKDLGFLAFSLLSWGWLSHTEWIAIGLLLLISAIKSSSWHWFIPIKQVHRWGDASAVFIILLLIQVYILQPTDFPMFVLLKSLPVLLAPVLLGQLLSRQARIPLSTVFYSLRKKNRLNTKTIDVQLPYAITALLSAGAANVQTASYFILISLLFSALLWSIKPQQSPVLLWLPVMLLVIAVSYLGQQGLRYLHTVVEQQSIQWLSASNVNPFKSETAIGDIGTLKLSNHIEFRLKAEGQLLLHQASYDNYLGQAWIASKRIFTQEKFTAPPDNTPLKQLDILQQELDNTVLSLPDGTVSITGLDAATLQRTELGTIKIAIAPKTANYHINYTGKRLGKPSPLDIKTPKQHSDWLQAVSRQLKLTNLPPAVIADRIKDYFQQYFFYSLYLGTEDDADAALRDFMLHRKAGHCEYFAAATVLLLRQNGIPARFATGYSVSEYLPEEDLFLVRRRDAHAWAIAYLDGVWQPIDSTPAQWQQMEADNANGFWQWLSDVWSNAWFYWYQWHITPAQKLTLKYSVLVCLSAYLLARRLKINRLTAKTAQPVNKQAINIAWDSEFYLLEQRLQHTPAARFDNESLQCWVQRLAIPEFITLCQLHYQLRFDPTGLHHEQRQQLRNHVNAWLTKNTQP